MRPLLFPSMVLGAVALALIRPGWFGSWLGWDLKLLIVPLLQVIMFGMGTTLSGRDFTRVLSAPVPVLVGVSLQYTVMPLVGWGVATALGFEPEVAAGIILVGTVAGGVASNLVTYLAGGDVALSVTMTACSTVVSPVLTPLWMRWLAGRLVPVDAVAMMVDILNMVMTPLVAGLVAHQVLYGAREFWFRGGRLLVVAAVSAAVFLGCMEWSPALPAAQGVVRGVALGAFLLAAVALARWLVSVKLGREGNWMDPVLSLVSMAGIALIIAIITARAREKLLDVGAWLVLAALAHNLSGYLFGYWGARGLRLDERQCRTVAIEVGMQNSGMASGLALTALQSAAAGLAAAIFGPVMNLTGAVLASWWRRRPVR